MIKTWHQRNRSYCLRRKNAWDKNRTSLISKPRVGHWSQEEDFIVLRQDITLVEKALLLQRNPSSVSNRRRDLEKSGVGQCAHCSESFFRVKPSKSQKPFYSRGLYCSKQCVYAAARLDGFERNAKKCLNCSQVFRARPASQKFCSFSCMGQDKRIHCARQCEFCKSGFVPRGDRKYCSNKCYGAAKTEKANQKNLRVCLTCSSQFVSQSGRGKYCSRKCAGIARRKSG